MDLRGRCNEGIHGVNGSATRLTPRDQSAAFVGNGAINQSDASFEPEWQLTPKPFIQLLAAYTFGEPLDAVAQLSKGDYAEKHAILVHVLEPFDKARIRTWLGPLGDDVRIEKVAQSSTSLPVS